jgi:bifunctional enzyme CysN/CysC
LNEVGSCVLNISRAISFDTYQNNRSSGSFILIDRMTNATLGAGMIDAPLEASEHSVHNVSEIDAKARARLKEQEAKTLWIDKGSRDRGLKLAVLIEQKLHALGRHTHLIDNDKLRSSLNRDLGQTSEDQKEELRRLIEVARICTEAGLIVLVSSSLQLPVGQDHEWVTSVPFAQTGKSTEEQADELVRSFFC